MSKKREGIDPEIERRCARVLSVTFRGLHHVETWERRQPLYRGLSVTTRQDLASYDYDLLTRLVVAAHDEAVRVSIDNGGPGALKIKLWPRVREGGMTERHPTIEDSVTSVRKWDFMESNLGGGR